MLTTSSITTILTTDTYNYQRNNNSNNNWPNRSNRNNNRNNSDNSNNSTNVNRQETVAYMQSYMSKMNLFPSYVNSVQIKAMRDTGSFAVIVHSKLVKPEQFLQETEIQHL